MQVHNRRKPGRHRHQITIQIKRITCDAAIFGVDAGNFSPANMTCAFCFHQRVAGVHINAAAHGLADQWRCRGRAHINNRPQINPSINQSQCRAIGIVIIGHDNSTAARGNAISGDITADSRRQHHTRAVIAAKDHWPFMGALRQHHMFGANFPHPLARHMLGRFPQMISHPFHHGQVIVIHITKDGGALQHGDVFHRLQFRHRISNPLISSIAIKGGITFRQQPAAKFILFIGKDNPRTGTASGQCRH